MGEHDRDEHGENGSEFTTPGESAPPTQPAHGFGATGDLVGRSAADDPACAAATREAMRYFTDQGWSYPPARVGMAVELISVLGRYLTDAVEHSGQLDSADLDRRFEFVCALTDMAYEQRRLYWLLGRWAQECATEGTLGGIDAVWTAHRFRDAQKYATALGDALNDAHTRIGRDIDRTCSDHEGSNHDGSERNRPEHGGRVHGG
ncbi:hypothetical protein [Nocardia bovistercoris]|uniref:Uncharacterized protein n=1 Tax=Nocardia bovistercoris TaxID=2785916 RepID=A0A931I803_9NOCA|nr:hypothetical protein [Nocardia bovistercoris]MBH0776549.1 hypothetical protein [Nocardia bovistercoris]